MKLNLEKFFLVFGVIFFIFLGWYTLTCEKCEWWRPSLFETYIPKNVQKWVYLAFGFVPLPLLIIVGIVTRNERMD